MGDRIFNIKRYNYITPWSHLNVQNRFHFIWTPRAQIQCQQFASPIFFFYIANVSQPKLMSKSRFPNEIKLCAIGSLFFSYRVCVLLFLNHFMVILLLYRLNINIFSLSTMSVNDETYWYLCVYFHFQLWNLVIIEQFENTNTAANTPHTCTRFCSITA